MAQYKLLIAYDGTDYYGWQQQPEVPTVASTLENCFYRVFKQKISITGASRTDAGVHALGQVACCTINLPIEPENILRAWNNSLPQDILLRKLDVLDPLDIGNITGSTFNPRYSVTHKIYYYHIFTQRPLPFLARYGTYYRYNFSPEKLLECLQVFVGTHDFRSFCTGCEQKTTVRSITSITLVYLQRYNVYRILFVAPGFLRYMIRRIVGACLDIASSPTRSSNELVFALNEKNPIQSYYTAPAQGLVLYKVCYAHDNLK